MGFLSLYESKHGPIQEELIYDFVEGYNRAWTQDEVYLTLRGEAHEVTKKIVHEVLDLV